MVWQVRNINIHIKKTKTKQKPDPLSSSIFPSQKFLIRKCNVERSGLETLGKMLQFSIKRFQYASTYNKGMLMIYKTSSDAFHMSIEFKKKNLGIPNKQINFFFTMIEKTFGRVNDHK